MASVHVPVAEARKAFPAPDAFAFEACLSAWRCIQAHHGLQQLDKDCMSCIVDTLLSQGSPAAVIRLGSTCRACRAACARIMGSRDAAGRASGRVLRCVRARHRQEWGMGVPGELVLLHVWVFDHPEEAIWLLSLGHINVACFATAVQSLVRAQQECKVDDMVVALPEQAGCRLPYRAIILAFAHKHGQTALQRAGYSCPPRPGAQFPYWKGLQLPGTPGMHTLVPVRLSRSR